MFFNKKKKTKLDPKVRFQLRGFTQKLERARQYKRIARVVPENTVDRILTKVKLGTRLAQIAVGLFVLAVLYIVYVPNFLTAQEIKVRGLQDADTVIAESSVRQAISNAPFYNPQHNLVFLSNDRVRSAAAGVPSVYEVTQVKKDYKSQTIWVDVTAKYPRYLVADAERVYDIYNDGSLKGVAGISKEQWEREQNLNMIKILVYGKLEPQQNTKFLSDAIQRAIDTTLEAYKAVTGSPIAYIALGDSQRTFNPEVAIEVPQSTLALPLFWDELKLVLKKGAESNRNFTVILDTKANLAESIVRLSNLLAQTAPDRYQNLDYID
ncbi:MAG: hypothetical protein M3Q64_00270, partial [bacterium]|nr:hypothetical protein [bacterium]